MKKPNNKVLWIGEEEKIHITPRNINRSTFPIKKCNDFSDFLEEFDLLHYYNNLIYPYTKR